MDRVGSNPFSQTSLQGSQGHSQSQGRIVQTTMAVGNDYTERLDTITLLVPKVLVRLVHPTNPEAEHIVGRATYHALVDFRCPFCRHEITGVELIDTKEKTERLAQSTFSNGDNLLHKAVKVCMNEDDVSYFLNLLADLEPQQRLTLLAHRNNKGNTPLDLADDHFIQELAQLCQLVQEDLLLNAGIASVAYSVHSKYPFWLGIEGGARSLPVHPSTFQRASLPLQLICQNPLNRYILFLNTHEGNFYTMNCPDLIDQRPFHDPEKYYNFYPTINLFDQSLSSLDIALKGYWFGGHERFDRGFIPGLPDMACCLRFDAQEEVYNLLAHNASFTFYSFGPNATILSKEYVEKGCAITFVHNSLGIYGIQFETREEILKFDTAYLQRRYNPNEVLSAGILDFEKAKANRERLIMFQLEMDGTVVNIAMNGKRSIGREGDIIVHGPAISRLHAYFEIDEQGQLTLTDDASANGISVMGMRMEGPQVLTPLCNRFVLAPQRGGQSLSCVVRNISPLMTPDNIIEALKQYMDTLKEAEPSQTLNPEVTMRLTQASIALNAEKAWGLVQDVFRDLNGRPSPIDDNVLPCHERGGS